VSQTRRLAAILAADVAGYSRLMGADEEGTHGRLKGHLRELVNPKINEHRGRIVKNTGDGFLAEFASVVDAVRCAAEVQRGMVERNAEAPPEERIEFRIGVNVGDVIAEEHDIFGDGVNVAARLEALAEPNGICISRMVRDQIRDKLPYAFEDLGQQSVKNIARPVRVYALRAEGLARVPVAEVSPRASQSPAVPAPRLSIVVLPFVNLSNDPEQEYFADGITDDLTTDLSRISGTFVIARNTAFTCKGKSIDAKQLGRELGVRYIVEGSVRRTSDQVRVNVQLIDAETGAHVWADRFETDRANLTDAQDAITGRLARTLDLELIEAVGRRIEREDAVDSDARDLVMRGWALYHRPATIATRREAQRAFERALAVDPKSVDARIGIATVLVANLPDGWGSDPVQHDMARAEQLLRDAFEGDVNRATTHFAMGVLRRLQNRLTEARIELEATVALNRNHAGALDQLGLTLMYLGQPEAGIPYIDRAIRLSPRDTNAANYHFHLGACHLLLGHVDQAVDVLTRARSENSRFWYIHLWLAGALALKGDLDQAKAALTEGIELGPGVSSSAGWRAESPWYTNPQFTALAETTLYVGLRRAGFPDE
jgi:adenylate cyclase